MTDAAPKPRPPARPMGPAASRRRPAARRVLLACDYYIHEAHEGIVGYAKQVGWIVDARTRRAGVLPPNWFADGILTYVDSSDRLGPTLRASGLPIVNMSHWRADLRLPTVALDDRGAGRLAAEHLIGCCLNHLAMVQFAPGSLTSAARREGFEQAAQGAGRTFHPLVMVGGEPMDRASQLHLTELADAIGRLPKPVGILTEGDAWAVEVIHLCQQMGLSVPEEVAVIGVDNDPLVVDVAPVPVSSVDNNMYGLGYRAAELLDQLMDGQPAPAEPVLVPPVGVAQRASTSLLAATHEEVAAALAFIHANFREPITVADVAAELSISRRRLQDLFLRHVNRTISGEITRHRLNLAKQLLHESQLKVGMVAERCGFGSHARMTKVFSRVLGMTPAEFRQDRPVSGGGGHGSAPAADPLLAAGPQGRVADAS
jgi:LacI family transcriptional regulator